MANWSAPTNSPRGLNIFIEQRKSKVIGPMPTPSQPCVLKQCWAIITRVHLRETRGQMGLTTHFPRDPATASGGVVPWGEKYPKYINGRHYHESTSDRKMKNYSKTSKSANHRISRRAAIQCSFEEGHRAAIRPLRITASTHSHRESKITYSNMRDHKPPTGL